MVCSVLPAVESVTTPPSPLLASPGAVVAEGVDAGVAAHYGDPLREQRLLTEGLAAVDLSHRGVVTVTGPDRLSWLHSITTQMLTGLAPLTSTESLVLSPKGHIEHDLHLVDDGQTTWITTEPGTSAALTAWLDSMRFMLRVEVADVTADWAVLGEPVRAETVAGEPLAWSDPWPRLVGDTAAYGTVVDHPGSSARGASCWCDAPTWSPSWATGRWPAPGPPRRCGSPLGGPGWASRPTTAPSRTRSTGCGPPSTCTRAATAARRQSPGCTTSAVRRDAWCSCTSTARVTRCRYEATRSSWTDARSASSPRSAGTTRTAPSRSRSSSGTPPWTRS